MFVVCGEALFDLFGRETEEGLAFDARIGGSPFNVAIGLARLRQDAALLTGLSTDPLGRRLRAALAAEGVSTEFVVESDRHTTLGLVEIGPDGLPAYAFYGEGAADRWVRPEDLPEFGPDVWGIHAGSLSLAVEPVGASLLSLLRRERRRRLVTIDPNVRLTAQPDIGIWRERIKAFVATSDLVKVSEEDLDLLHPGVPPEEIARRWIGTGAALVVVTRGGDGAEVHGGFGSVSVPGRRVEVIDTVGAGDSFMAAMICRLAEAGWVRRADLEAMGAGEARDLIDFAAGVAAITCSRRGANPPRIEELAGLRG